MHRYQRALGTCCRPYHHAAERTRSRAYRRWILATWRARRAHAIGRWHASPVRENLMCIHRGEGPWNANTGNGYYGGLQMDASFMSTYGPGYAGTADTWTPLEQLTAGARAVRVRGYSPWPTTGAACGLL